MSIWTYADTSSTEFPYATKGVKVREGSAEGNRIVDLWYEEQCPFCKAGLTNAISIDKKETTSDPPRWQDHHEFFSAELHVCTLCGWWKARYISEWFNPAECCYDLFQGGASLKELDVTDLSIPLQEICDYLAANYSERFKVHPQKFEQVVGSVFANLGYSTVVTGYSGDDGIDVILTKGLQTVGVQVKRYKDRIDVEQIRSLAGALVLNGLTQGIFVTTSSFQSGVPSTAERLMQKGYKIQLMDSERFFDALCISQREVYRSWEEFESLDVVKKLPLIRHIMEH
jgi:restriction system protein